MVHVRNLAVMHRSTLLCSAVVSFGTHTLATDTAAMRGAAYRRPMRPVQPLLPQIVWVASELLDPGMGLKAASSRGQPVC
jgi:hypothetical protein